MDPRAKIVLLVACLLLAVYMVHLHTAVHAVKTAILSEVDHTTDDHKRLGLTPKKLVRITFPDGGEHYIHGRFLHITDFHPDPFYREGLSVDEACHHGHGKALKYGDAILGCDSPMILLNDTINWVRDNFKDKIDFIVWTGDNVRHDNDRNFPRSEMHIFDMNQLVSDKMFDAFRNTNETSPVLMDVDMIPLLGNNDVYPHNLFAPGPTLQTREMYRVWKNYIPQVQLHTFNQGAYYFKEVIPNQLAVLSINTLYLFDLNPLVDNCDKRKEPGHRLFEWLGYVLREMRARNMKVWMTGHVPPNEKNYDTTCLRKYIAWSHEYRDVIIGGLYGHMNMDHFYPLDSVAAYKSIDDDFGGKTMNDDLFDVEVEDYDSDGDDDDTTPALKSRGLWHEEYFRIQGGVPNNKVEYMETVRDEVYAQVKRRKKSGKHGQRYLVVQVGALVIPTFNPGFRVYEYNITHLPLQKVAFVPWEDFFAGVAKEMSRPVEVNSQELDNTFPPKLPKDLKLGPGYTPQLFSPERYVLYYLDLEQVNAGKKKFAYEIEYTSEDVGFKGLLVEDWLEYARTLARAADIDSLDEDEVDISGKKKKKKGKKKKGGKKHKKEKEAREKWELFLKYSFVSSDYEHKGYG